MEGRWKRPDERNPGGISKLNEKSRQGLGKGQPVTLTHKTEEPASREIPLTQGKVAIVDAGDYERISSFRWCASKERGRFYARRSIRVGSSWTTLLMHREIMGVRASEQIDHRNHDTLDNRRTNLRICTSAENARNRRADRDSRVGLKGVRLQGRGFEAHIKICGKQIYLGSFESAEAAARAYDRAAIEHFGEFAMTNEILGLLPPISQEKP